MKVLEAIEGGVLRLAPDGNLSGADECAALDQRLGRLLAERARFVVFDLERVGLIGGPALRTLLFTARKLARRQGRLVFCRPSEPVRRIFAISGLDRDFVVADSLEEAVRQAAVPGAGAAPRPAAGVSPPDPLAALVELVAATLGSGPATGGAGGTAPAPGDPTPGDLDGLAALVLETLAGIPRGTPTR